MHDYPLTFSSADGTTGRLRLPGGRVRSGGWEALVGLAELGDGRLHLTSRGNLQVRGIGDAAAFREQAMTAGMGPGPAVIASPLSRLDSLVESLTASLPGTTASPRLVLGIDDGSGDILAESPDLGLQLVGAGARLITRGQLTGEVAETEQILAHIADKAPTLAPTAPAPTAAPGTGQLPPVGWLPADDGTVTLGAGLRFGVLDAKVASMLDVIGVETTVTPWRSLLIHGLSESIAEQVVRVLAPLGLLFDASSPLLRISACVGAPACHHGLSDTRADALQAAAAGTPGRIHFVGCARNCGRPRQGHTLYQATGDGEYDVLEPAES